MNNTFSHSMKRFVGLVVLLLGAALAQAAESFPSRPITLLIPYPPGGTADTVGRPLAAELGKRLKVPVIVDYKGGAGGTIATRAVARSSPDGYTLLMVLAAHSINPSLYKELGYDAVKDFAPISMVARLPLVLYTHPAFPPKSVGELIAYGKQHPGEMTFSSAGSGNTSHLAAELFASTAGMKILHVPYKGGGPAVTAAIAGDVSAVFGGPDSLGLVKAGKLRMVAVTGRERWPYAPNVPTVSESGLKEFEVYGWYGVVAPAGTPSNVINVLNEGIVATLKDPAFQKIVEPLGYSVTPSTPAEFKAYIQAEQTRWAAVVKKAGVELQ